MAMTKVERAAYIRAYRLRKKKTLPPFDASGNASADDLIAWIESTLRVPTGPLPGQPFLLGQWQKELLIGALAPGIREAGLSIARKNGKSRLIADLLLGHLVGPLNAPQWRGIVVSLTGVLAKELRDAVELTASASNLDGRIVVKRSPSPGSIEGANGARLTVLASDKATGHALGSDLAVIDEAGLIQESGRDLWAAVLSSTSGRDGRMLAISIRGDGPMFTEMENRAESDAVHWREFAAAEGCSLDDTEGWAAANPGLSDGIKSLTYMHDASERAIAIPADACSFRAYDLNQRRNPSVEMLCEPESWRACESLDLPPRSGDCVVGFDIGGSSSLTALAALWPETGRLEAWAAVGDTPGLLERSRADGLGDTYCQMESRGELATYPGRVTPVAAFLQDCADRMADSRIILAGADRHRKAEVEDTLNAAGLRWRMEWRGQGASGAADGSHDVRALQRLVPRERLAVPESLLLRSAVSEAIIRRDASGNPALNKRRERGRIDALSACVIVAGLAELVGAGPKRSRGVAFI